MNQTAIQINATDVVLDLNGFNVRCSYDPNLNADIIGCIQTRGTVGVHNITIRNGTVLANESGASAINHKIRGLDFSFSDRITMEDLHIEVNADDFFLGESYAVGAQCIIRHNILSGNRGLPATSCPSLVEGNVNTTTGDARFGTGCVFANNVGPF